MKWVCLQVWETFNVDMGRGTFWQNFGGIWEFMNNADRPAFLERELVG